MKIKRFEVPGLAQYSYVISADGSAAVIDAIRDIDRYTEYTRQEGLKIEYVLETHIHADFAAGSTALARETGAQLALSAYDQGERYTYSMPHRSLASGDVVDIGTIRLQALHTPGHTPEHLSFVLFDTERNASEPVAIFSGDFLFVGSLGRPDLLGDEASKDLAHKLYDSLHNRIATLPDGVQVYPGHGAGSLCGAGMSERADSTLGYEREANQLFKLNEDQFVREILATVPPMPSYYPRMKELNAQGAPLLNSIPGTSALTLMELKDLMTHPDVSVLDLRRPEAYGGAHIAGSINIGAGQNLSLWAGWMVDPGKRIVIVNDKGDDESSRRALIRVGLDNIVGFLAKGIPTWIDAGLDFSRVPQLSASEVKNRGDATEVVDVRSDKEWAGGHIDGAQHIMLGDLRKQLSQLPRDRSLVTVCGSGYRSSIAASVLAQHGFRDVSSMNGGMTAWDQQKLPKTKE